MNTLTLKRILKLGLTNLWRNRWLSAQAILVLTVTLIFVITFIFGQMILKVAVNAVKEKIDVTVYFEDSVPELAIKDLQTQIAARQDIKSVRYISKEEALEIWQGRPISPKIKGLVSSANNPLPRSLQIKTDEKPALESIADLFSSTDFTGKVRRVSYQETKAAIDRLLALTRTIERIGLALSVLFVVISVVVILNTVRLAIFTRRQEIEVMRLVGASTSFVRTPFLLEAVIYSLAASLIGLSAASAAIWFASPIFGADFGGPAFNLWLFYLARLPAIAVAVAGLSFALTLVSSLWETRRHLTF